MTTLDLLLFGRKFLPELQMRIIISIKAITHQREKIFVGIDEKYHKQNFRFVSFICARCNRSWLHVVNGLNINLL